MFSWDRTVVLTVPGDVLLARLATRSSSDFGKSPDERGLVLADRAEVEPVLMASADLVVDTREALSAVVDDILAVARPAGGPQNALAPVRARRLVAQWRRCAVAGGVRVEQRVGHTSTMRGEGTSSRHAPGVR